MTGGNIYHYTTTTCFICLLQFQKNGNVIKKISTFFLCEINLKLYLYKKLF